MKISILCPTLLASLALAGCSHATRSSAIATEVTNVTTTTSPAAASPVATSSSIVIASTAKANTGADVVVTDLYDESSDLLDTPISEDSSTLLDPERYVYDAFRKPIPDLSDKPISATGGAQEYPANSPARVIRSTE